MTTSFGFYPEREKGSDTVSTSMSAGIAGGGFVAQSMLLKSDDFVTKFVFGNGLVARLP